MAEETITPAPESTETQVTDATSPAEATPTETPPAEEPSAEPHTLEPGGARFKQVVARAHKAEDLNTQLKDENARQAAELASIKVVQQPSGAQDQTIEQQIEAGVEAGTISQFEAIRRLSEHYSDRRTAQSDAKRADEVKNQTAIDASIEGIKRYTDVAPDIKTLTHPRIKEVEDTYNTLVSRGYSKGITTEWLALDMTFGSPDKLKRSKSSTDRTSTPVTSGGGSIAAPEKPGSKKGLEGIPKRYIDYWSSRKYSHEDMVAEAQYLSPEQKARKE